MTRVCLSLLAGMYALQLSSFSNLSDYLGGAFVAACTLFLLRQWAMLLCFCAGVALFHGAAERLKAARLPAAIAGDSIVIDVEVADFPAHDEKSVSFLARPFAAARVQGRVRLSWFEPPVDIHPGDRWRLEVRLRRRYGRRKGCSIE